MLSPLSSTGLDERLVADWAGVQLPDAWPDRLRWQRLTHPLRIASAVLRGRAGRVVLPENLPGSAALPKYLLQEFHNLPNGNYSKSVTRGYARAFDALERMVSEGKNSIAAVVLEPLVQGAAGMRMYDAAYLVSVGGT